MASQLPSYDIDGTGFGSTPVTATWILGPALGRLRRRRTGRPLYAPQLESHASGRCVGRARLAPQALQLGLHLRLRPAARPIGGPARLTMAALLLRLAPLTAARHLARRPLSNAGPYHDPGLSGWVACAMDNGTLLDV